jgi:predicted DNA-binding transcriptional regulator YafY
MTKSNRLFDLMQVLRRHRRPVSGSELAQEAGVSLRTIRRYVSTLQAMGAEIEGEPGFGYVLKPGFVLPPLTFSEEELHALALGAQWVTRQTDDALSLAARNALGKIDAVLPFESRQHLSDNAFHVGRKPALAFDLQLFRQAMREQRRLRIVYLGPEGTRTERVIWPIMLGFIDTRRFIAGWCELRLDFRTFRIDRIEQVEVLLDRYPGRRRDLVKQWRVQVATAEGRTAQHSEE